MEKLDVCSNTFLYDDDDDDDCDNDGDHDEIKQRLHWSRQPAITGKLPIKMRKKTESRLP